MAWPSPEPYTLTVYPKGSSLILPGRKPLPEIDDRISFKEPEGAPGVETTIVKSPENNWIVQRDLAENSSTLKVIRNSGTRRIEDINLEIENRTKEWYTTVANDHESPRGEVITHRGYRRDDWHVQTRTRTVLTSDKTHFRIRAELDAYKNGHRFFSKSWDECVARDCV